MVYQYVLGEASDHVNWPGLTGHATPDNIDYDELKHSIKVLTTKDASRARPIPNSGYEARQEQASQDRLFTDLENQHDRVNDFVQVKAGELSRRLSMAIPEKRRRTGLTALQPILTSRSRD